MAFFACVCVSVLLVSEHHSEISNSLGGCQGSPIVCPEQDVSGHLSPIKQEVWGKSDKNEFYWPSMLVLDGG